MFRKSILVFITIFFCYSVGAFASELDLSTNELIQEDQFDVSSNYDFESTFSFADFESDVSENSSSNLPDIYYRSSDNGVYYLLSSGDTSGNDITSLLQTQIELEQHILSTNQMVLSVLVFFFGISAFRRFRKGAFLQK